jgi:hypothetical protein
MRPHLDHTAGSGRQYQRAVDLDWREMRRDGPRRRHGSLVGRFETRYVVRGESSTQLHERATTLAALTPRRRTRSPQQIDQDCLVRTSLSAPWGGEGRGEVGGYQSADSAHLTLPVAAATGPLPLPPKGREGIHCSRSGSHDSHGSRSHGCGLRLPLLAARVDRRRVQSRACDRGRRNRQHKTRPDAAAESGARSEARAAPATSPSRLPLTPAATAVQPGSAFSVPSDASCLPLCP